MHTYPNQIDSIVQHMSTCYQQRKPENIDALCDRLFKAGDIPIIIGTSNGEWCFGIDDAKKLLLSDWESWGNVTFDRNTLALGAAGPLAWFAVNAGVEYCFEDDPGIYRSYLDFVKSIAKSEAPSLARAGEILWVLSHLLHTRNSNRRRYIWDMNLSGILRIEEGQWKVKEMQFSLPVLSAFPDVRIDTDMDAAKYFAKECDGIAAYIQRIRPGEESIAKKLALIWDERGHVEWVDRDDRFFIGMDGKRRSGCEFALYWKTLRQNGFSVQVEAEHLIVQQQGNDFWFCGVGIISRPVLLQEELETVLEGIDSNTDEQGPKELLFAIRRDLALALKEGSVSDKHTAPFRMEGVGKIHGETLEMEYLQASYPFNWILEQKTDASKTCE